MNGRHWMVWGLMLVVALMLVYFFSSATPTQAIDQLSYSEFREYVAEGAVERARIEENVVTGDLSNGARFVTNVPRGSEAAEILYQGGVQVEVIPP